MRVVSVFLCGQNQSQNCLRNHCPESELGQKPREAEMCQSKKGELSTGQREINSGWGTVRGADCIWFRVKERAAEVSIELATVPVSLPSLLSSVLLRARPFRLVLSFPLLPCQLNNFFKFSSLGNFSSVLFQDSLSFN